LDIVRLTSFAFGQMPRRFGQVFMDREIAQSVDGIGFLASLDDEFLWKASDWRIPASEAPASSPFAARSPPKLIGEAVQQKIPLRPE